VQSCNKTAVFVYKGSAILQQVIFTDFQKNHFFASFGQISQGEYLLKN